MTTTVQSTQITPAAAALRIDNVSVRYGTKSVLEAVTLEVPRGVVYALLGRNGAGKTSLIRCLLGQQKPNTGRIDVFGQDVWKHRASLMERVGVVPEQPDAPDTCTAEFLMPFYASLYPTWDEAAFRDRMRRFEVSMRTPLGRLSRGHKALFMLAFALSTKPEFLVLDDPTLGLDLVARNSFFGEFITELAERDTTVLITTHDIAGVEGIASRVGIFSGARLVIDDDIEALKAAQGRSLEQIFIDATRSGGRVAA